MTGTCSVFFKRKKKYWAQVSTLLFSSFAFTCCVCQEKKYKSTVFSREQTPCVQFGNLTCSKWHCSQMMNLAPDVKEGSTTFWKDHIKSWYCTNTRDQGCQTYGPCSTTGPTEGPVRPPEWICNQWKLHRKWQLQFFNNSICCSCSTV